jgi:GNAT superfamily N-acetyltransferase
VGWPPRPVELACGSLRELSEADLDDLQALFERSADYFELHESAPPGPNAARHEWDALPDDTSPASKHLVGLYAPHLAGVVELIRDWPRPRTWNIGLLLLEPRARGAAVGTEIVGAVDARAAAAGADTLRISVLQANARGMRFWRRLRFEPVPAVGADPAAFAFERPVGS